ncbi:hypothetical protein Tco_1519964 [Tanacetum coccineum]
MACHGSRHRHLYQQVIDVFKYERRLSEAIWITCRTRNTLLEMGKYSHGFYHKPAKDNKLLLHDLGNQDHQKNYANVRRKPLKFQVGGTVACRLELPEQLRGVHNTFHVANLKKCLSNKKLVTLLDEIQINGKPHFIEEPRLKQSGIPIVKVRWNSRRGPEFT